ncbi:MAG: TIGR03084 family metal-binding protein [Myxococcota bacterium]
MLQEARDLIDEMEELGAFLATLAPEDWSRPTGFMDWTPWDVVAHLHYFDLVSLVALQGEEVFAPERKALFEAISAGRTNQELARERFGDVAPDELIERWRETGLDMATQLGESEPTRRLPWFGPDMGVRMFTTARYMETWAHAQEIHDLLGVKRHYTDRIRNIAVIGVKTFGWTFANRGEKPPGPPPYVRLEAPSGAVWEFGEPSDEEFVKGTAVDFCHVVTQGRNVADTALEVKGPVATRWMSIAQCFAGGPVDPPAPGTRKGA